MGTRGRSLVGENFRRSLYDSVLQKHLEQLLNGKEREMHTKMLCHGAFVWQLWTCNFSLYLVIVYNAISFYTFIIFAFRYTIFDTTSLIERWLWKFCHTKMPLHFFNHCNKSLRMISTAKRLFYEIIKKDTLHTQNVWWKK